MTTFFTSVLNVVADRLPEELVGALLIALGLSLLMSGVFRLARRRVSDSLALICGQMILVSIGSMVLSAGYVRYVADRDGVREASSFLASQPGRAMLVRRIFDAADTDADGRLAPEEAARAAALFVRSLETSGESAVDEDAIRNALRCRLMQPPANRSRSYR
jgi:hypothetical protein